MPDIKTSEYTEIVLADITNADWIDIARAGVENFKLKADALMKKINDNQESREAVGFENRTDSSITTLVGANREFTITGTNFGVYVKGVKYLKNLASP